jgi:hypothetical protein
VAGAIAQNIMTVVPAWTIPLTLAARGDAVGGAALSAPDDDGGVSIGCFNTYACWRLGPGWIEVVVHPTDLGHARGVLLGAVKTSLSRRWYFDHPRADASWRGPGSPSLGSLGSKVGGRAGFLQSTPGSELDSMVFLAQLDSETDLLYAEHREVLCDGAIYLYGRLAVSEIVDTRVLWQY